MSLMSDVVDVNISTANAKRYESLGYCLPKHENGKIKYNSIITINISDLSNESHVKVPIKCDLCGKESVCQYRDYYHHNYDGKTYCNSCKGKVFNSGENNHLWNPNLTDEDRNDKRNYPEYNDFIRRVSARDNYKCIICGKPFDAVHHLDSYNWCIEGRTLDTNGVCLCKNCHKNFHMAYGYGDNTKQQFEEWVGYVLDNLSFYNEPLPTRKRVYCFETDTVYENSDIAALELDCKSGSIEQACCLTRTTTKSHREKHFMWENDYIKMLNDGTLEDYKEWLFSNPIVIHGKVILLNTLEVFDTCSDAANTYGCNDNSIRSCCYGLNHSAGMNDNCEPLIWAFYEDYINDPDKTMEKMSYTTFGSKPVVCLTTGEIFKSIKDAENKYNIKNSRGISNCCKGLQEYSGTYNGVKLKWMFLSDYKNVPENDKLKYIEIIKKE